MDGSTIRAFRWDHGGRIVGDRSVPHGISRVGSVGARKSDRAGIRLPIPPSRIGQIMGMGAPLVKSLLLCPPAEHGGHGGEDGLDADAETVIFPSEP